MPRRPPASIAAVVGRVVTLLVVVTLLGAAGCSTGDAPATKARKASPTPIAKLNTGVMTLARVEFCPLVSTSAVRAALDGTSESVTSWRNGDKAQVEDTSATGAVSGLDDVVHEYGCRWSRSGGSDPGTTTASAWLFARTLTRKDAQAVIRDNRVQPGCRVTRVPGFGSPSQFQLCTTDGVRRARVAGLFGDSWLTCQVSAPTSVSAASLTRRTDAWCVNVANATNTTK